MGSKGKEQNIFSWKNSGKMGSGLRDGSTIKSLVDLGLIPNTMVANMRL